MATIEDHLRPLPEDALLDIARNDAAPRASKLAAVKLLIERESRHTRHPDILVLVAQRWAADNPLPEPEDAREVVLPDPEPRDDTMAVSADMQPPAEDEPPVEVVVDSPESGQAAVSSITTASESAAEIEATSVVYTPAKSKRIRKPKPPVEELGSAQAAFTTASL